MRTVVLGAGGAPTAYPGAYRWAALAVICTRPQVVAPVVPSIVYISICLGSRLSTLTVNIFKLFLRFIVTMSQPPGMAAPSIPNLLSLRDANGGGRGRGRGRGSNRGGRPHTTSSQAQHDATIQGTDTDAAISRLSAVHLGYLEDPFAPYFVQGQALSRRLPLINRGRSRSYLPTVLERARRLMAPRHIHEDESSGYYHRRISGW